ncbi:hypothetical protein LTR01_007116 [Friedmanniomyces endolithicus]|nr:hypothetical protein LTR01_007116 [Friedmanniomyces endolithicus]KAK0823805.1 hypothetical protein LTR73_008271 [Friedmanniomyces endolithicus]
MPPNAADTKALQILITTTLTQLASSAVFLSPSAQSTATLTTTPIANPPNPLHVLRDAALLVKAHTTKFSLLAITAPFTPSAITKVLRQLAAESLPAMLSAVHICRQELTTWGTMMATEAQSRVRRVYKEMETLLQEILALSHGQDYSSKTRNSLSSTAVVWETCDALVALSTLGISGLAVQKAEQYRDTVQDAIEELREWAAGEDQETEGHDALLDDNDEGVEGDRDSLMEEMFHAANSLPADRVELKELVEEAGRRLKRVVLLYTAVVKRRFKTFQEGDATVGRLDEAVEGMRRIPHMVDELAGCFYDLDEDKARAMLDKCVGEAVAVATVMREDWNGGSDEFTAWSMKWRDATVFNPAPDEAVCCTAVAVMLPLPLELILALPVAPAAEPVALAVAADPVAVAVAVADPVPALLPTLAQAPSPTGAAVYVLPAALNALEHTAFESWITASKSELVQVEWQRQGMAAAWMADWPVVHWQR